MIGRITPGYIQNDFLKNIQNQDERLQKTRTQLTSNMRVNLPSDDPANTINYMEWEGKKSDINTFNQIITTYKEKMNMVDAQLDAVTSSMQRIRELTVQAATGTYSKDDRIIMAGEVDQLIRQMVSDANLEYKGIPMFGGTSTTLQPYRITETIDPNLSIPIISKVDYYGNAQERIMDIGRNDRIVSLSPGSTIFQTTKTILQGTNDVTGYLVPEDTRILIEGEEINILSGDNLETIVEKINNAKLTVTASIEFQEDGRTQFRLTSISARQPWLQDLSGGKIFQDLGVVDAGVEGPSNYSPQAIVEKNSVFDVLVNLRDSMLSNDILKIGGEDLNAIDQSMNNLIRYRTYSGAVSERLEKTFARNETESVYLGNAASHAINTDFTKTLTEFKMAEFAYQAALNIGAKLMPTTLMDFLR